MLLIYSDCSNYMVAYYRLKIYNNFYFSGRGGSIAISIVCMYVCLSVCPLASLKTTRLNFTPFSVHVTSCCRAFMFLWRQCDILRTSGFVDDVTFSHNTGNRPESNTTRMFRPVSQVATLVGRQSTLFGRDCWVAALGDEVCCFRPHLVTEAIRYMLDSHQK